MGGGVVTLLLVFNLGDALHIELSCVILQQRGPRLLNAWLLAAACISGSSMHTCRLCKSTPPITGAVRRI